MSAIWQTIIALALVALAAAFLVRRAWRTRAAGCASGDCGCSVGRKANGLFKVPRQPHASARPSSPAPRVGDSR